MIKRDLYLKQIKAFIDKPLIKVITGIRRSGKSIILRLLKEDLLERGIGENQIIYLNFESLEFSDISDAENLYSYIKERITKNKRSYLLLDEIQEVNSWERAINSFLADFDVDIFITGSNSRLLSSELATYLTGRYVEIHLYPLSFSEHLRFKTARTGKTELNTKTEFETFLRMGGLQVFHIAEYSI
jgi:predicted AAA+ superfamily ATPase